jgi:hypothetical protein
MHLLLLPGMDGTGRLFGPLLRALQPTLSPVVVAYPVDQPYGYAELLPFVETLSTATWRAISPSFRPPSPP